jgi:lysyl-tRNA synthetase class 2
MGRTLRATAGGVAAFAVVLAASGWLYVVQPHSVLPGPGIADALPLDELSRRSAVPILVFLGVWALAAALLGGIVAVLRTERLTAGLMLALGVGGWSYLAMGASLLIVRQVPAHQAFHAAATKEAVYLPAALAGLAGAIAGRARRTVKPRAPLVLAWFVAAAGFLGVLDALLPDQRRALIGSLAPERVHGVSTALVAPLGLALVVAARGLARRKRRAWQITVAVLGALVALHLQHRFGYGAIATGLVAVALLARRHDFDAPGDPEAHPRILLRATFAAGGIVAYGCVALWLNRMAADQPYTLGFALRETVQAAAGITATGSTTLGARVGEWFPISVLLLTVGTAGVLLFEWLAPWRYRLTQEAHERELTRALVAAWGVDTLAPFVLRGDKSYFFGEEERAFLAYKVVGGVAIVSSDPIGPPERFHDLVGDFMAFAHARGWRVAILGASQKALDLYAGHGLHALYHGDEAVVDVRSFSLDGRAIRKVRQSVHRLERAGFSLQVLRPSELGDDLREQLEAVARAWRGAQPERGFVMAIDTLFRLDDEHALFVVGFGPDGKAAGFLHFAVCRRGSALSLSSMPRLRTTPNGFTEWLVCATVEWARANGFGRVSLNFSPFAALLAPEAELSALQRLERRALLQLKGQFQLDNLLLFNRKFFPMWQQRFVVYERRIDLPRIGIAALAAEAYLPLGGRDRT